MALPICNGLRGALLSLLLLAGASSAAAQEPTPAPSADHAKAFFDLLVRQDFAAATGTFTQAMLKAMPEATLRQFWTGVLAQAGSFQKHETERVETRGAYLAVILGSAFERTKADVTIVLDSAGRVAGLNMKPAAVPSPPPPYATPSAFAEREVTVGTNEWALPGTLSLPVGHGPFAAIVLVHGSGPNDRDETFGPNKTFRDLAHGLASRGIAVLRYDKRTRVHGKKLGAVTRFTVAEEAVDDAALAVALLAATPSIARDRIFVLGHSLGGMLIPRIAAAAPGAAGFVVLAGPARPLEQAMLEQTEYMARLDNVVSVEEQTQIDAMRTLLTNVRGLTPKDADSPQAVGGAPAAYWLDLRGYDPPEAAKAITRPMLVLQGERDYQVTMAEFARWKAALDSRPDVTLKSYPTLNHHFMSGSGPGTPAEYSVASHVAEPVVRDIAEWIAKR